MLYCVLLQVHPLSLLLTKGIWILHRQAENQHEIQSVNITASFWGQQYQVLLASPKSWLDQLSLSTLLASLSSWDVSSWWVCRLASTPCLSGGLWDAVLVWNVTAGAIWDFIFWGTITEHPEVGNNWVVPRECERTCPVDTANKTNMWTVSKNNISMEEELSGPFYSLLVWWSLGCSKE